MDRTKLDGGAPVKRCISIAALLLVLPLAMAAKCGGQSSTTETPSPAKSDHCVMTKDGCLSPRPKA